MTKRVFISADHGLAIVYFLQSQLVPTLLNAGVEVILLTDDELVDKITEKFSRPGLTIEGLRLKEANAYAETYKPTLQWWLHYFRMYGASTKINLQAVDSNLGLVEGEAKGRRRLVLRLMRVVLAVFRRVKFLRKAFVRYQQRFDPKLYADLFEKYQPDMVIASTPGWRMDKYLLREAAARGIPNTTVIVGWDNTSSYALSGVEMDWAVVWSDIQKEEFVLGSDWDPAQISIGGIPSYDGYFEKRWQMGKDKYFKLHGLDPDRKLISYAGSFITFSPNIQNIEALARLVSEDHLSEPSQLLIRLHPNHFRGLERFTWEREQIRELVEHYPHVHLVEPASLGGSLGHYSGEDMDEKTSMMAYSDVFVTVYSTMVVEATLHDRPVVSACIDHEVGWTKTFYLPLSKIGGWPTHSRFREAGAGRVALTEEELRQHLNFYLENPEADQEARRAFIARELTYTDASAGKRVGEILLGLIEKGRYQK